MGKNRLPDRRVEVICPRCGASLIGTKHCFIDWDEKKRQFDIRLAFYCPPCHHRFAEDFVKSLPLVIARESNCSCGSQLRLADFTLRQANNDIEFEGTYVCPNCELKKRTLLGKLKQGLQQFWSQTKRVEVGLSGVKYEKETGEENG